MELIVKIGADQQNLRDTVERIKRDFKNTNMSMPASWMPNVSAMQQYGSIMQSAGAGHGGFSQFKQELSEVSPALGSLAGKLSHLAGPLAAVGAAIGSVAAVVHASIDKLKESAAVARESRLTGFSASMVKNIRHAGGLSMGGDEAMAAMNKLNAAAGSALAGSDETMGMFNELGINPAGMTSDALIGALKKSFAGINDPGKRARLSKGLFGRGGFEISEMLAKLEAEPSEFESESVGRLAATKKYFSKKWAAFTRGVDKAFTEVLAYSIGMKGDELGSQTLGLSGELDLALKKQTDDAVKAEAEYRKAAFNRLSPEMKLGYLKTYSLPEAEKALAGTAPGSAEYWKSKNSVEQLQKEIGDLFAELYTKKDKPGKTGREEAPMTFQADALAQAGLYAGSSLLFNPNFSVEQQQLEVLRQIADNTGKPGVFER